MGTLCDYSVRNLKCLEISTFLRGISVFICINIYIEIPNLLLYHYLA